MTRFTPPTHGPGGSRRAFTLMELLISVAIASLMLFLINQIFNDTTRAVTRGVSLSDIIGNSRGVGDQLEIDASLMVGPHEDSDGTPWGDAIAEGGILVIVQHEVGATSGVYADIYAPPRSYTETRDTAHPDGPVRADQLVFVRDRNDAYPVAPSATNSFTPANDSGLADYARVWYGHVLRTLDNGDNPGSPLGQGANRFATDFILGRQALLLGEDTGTYTGPSIHANGAWIGAPTVGYGTSGNEPSWASGYASSRPPLHMGLTDYAYATLFNDSSGDPHPNGGLVGGATTYGNNPAFRLWSSLNISEYQNRAVLYHTYADARLRANPVPLEAIGYKSWQVAQMHPVFAPHVSDFIVEFAADTDLDGAIDTDDADSDASTPEIIKWYTRDEYANEPGTGGYEPTEPITYPLPAGNFKDDIFRNGIALSNGTASFVWRHDDTNFNVQTDAATYPDQESYWPYLIRIRYRMHDPRGVIESGAGQHGVWFEHVIRVNRP